MLLMFAQVSFRVKYGALQVRSLRNFRVNLYRRTPLKGPLSALIQRDSVDTRYLLNDYGIKIGALL